MTTASHGTVLDLDRVSPRAEVVGTCIRACTLAERARARGAHSRETGNLDCTFAELARRIPIDL